MPSSDFWINGDNFVKILKRLLSAAAVCLLLAGIIAYCQHLFRPVNTDTAFQQTEVFHSLPKDSLDVIIYGSSHAWRGVDANTMYNDYGINAYNYGCFWQHFNTTALFFHDSMKTQTPKLAVIETFRINKLLKDTDMYGEIYYTRGIGESEYKQQYLRQCFGRKGGLKELCLNKTIRDRYLSYYLPFTLYHSNWNSLTEASFTDGMLGEDLLSARGYHNVELYHGEAVYKAKIKDYRKFTQKKIRKGSLRWLEGIMEVCKEKGIEVLFFTAPYEGNFFYHNAIQEFADENGCGYIDFFEKMEECGISPETDFYDSGHLNDQGAQKQTRYLAEYIREHYDLPYAA